MKGERLSDTVSQEHERLCSQAGASEQEKNFSTYPFDRLRDRLFDTNITDSCPFFNLACHPEQREGSASVFHQQSYQQILRIAQDDRLKIRYKVQGSWF